MSLRAMLAVFDQSEATLAARLVLLALADNAHDDGTGAYPAVGTIAQKARVDDRTVQRALRDLEAAGEIEKTGTTKRGVTIWRLTFVRGDISSQEGGDLSPHPRQDATRTVIESPGNEKPSGDNLSPLQNWQPALGHRDPAAAIRRQILNGALQTGVDLEAEIAAVTLTHEERDDLRRTLDKTRGGTP